MTLSALGQTHQRGAPYGSLMLKTGQTTQYASELDDGYYEKGVAKSYTVLSSGQYSGTTNITVNSKTDAHSNAVVIDNNTGLMWSQTGSATVGPLDNGQLPWTTTGSDDTAEGIFPYCKAANTASLSGHTDWRIPNIYELISIMDFEAPTGVPNSTAFPSLDGASGFWTSTTRPNITTTAANITPNNGIPSMTTKTTVGKILLVRGG